MPEFTAGTILAEEYVVFSALIRARCEDEQIGLVIIRTQTEPVESSIQLLGYLQPQMPELTPEVVVDFVVKNKETYPLGTFFDTEIHYKLLSEEEEHDIFRAGAGWNNFYSKYPDSREILSFSRVGFSQRLDIGLVCIGYRMGPLAGGGDYVFLKKQDGAWVEEKRVIAWMA